MGAFCMFFGVCQVPYKRGVVMSGVVSLTMGNSRFPFRHSLIADVKNLCQLALSQILFLPASRKKSSDLYLIHIRLPPSEISVYPSAAECNLRFVEFASSGIVFLSSSAYNRKRTVKIHRHGRKRNLWTDRISH